MSTIPASEIVNVIPSVIAAGGTGLNGIGLMLSNGTRVPLGTVASFPNLAAVQSYFGLNSVHATEAAIYFAGFEGATIQPAALLCAEYNQSAASAYMRGGSLAAISLATLQGYSGTLSVTIDGNLKSASVNLSGATSFSNAAQIINGDLGIESVQAASFTGSISGTTLTVTTIASGALAVSDVINGTGVVVNTYITAVQSLGAGGTGTFTVSTPQTALSAPMTADLPGVTFDPISSAFIITSGTTGTNSTITFGSGAMATDLLLTQALGAVLSQGAAAAVPAAFMNALIVQNSNWVNFMTTFDPDNGSGNTVKQAFAAWKNTQNDRFGYFCWDPDNSPSTSNDATASLGRILAGNGDSGTLLIWEGGGAATTVDTGLCAFALGLAASINYGQTNGRADFAFKAQAGISANVTDPTTAANLTANGYNFYGAYGAANQNFIWFQTGQITGPFAWADSYETQVWLNSFFQTQLLALFQNSLSVPFTMAGSSLIQLVCQTVIQAGLAFGAFAPNTLTPGQIGEVNSQAGANIAGTLQSQGYYLQINLPSQVVQAARGPWPLIFWYIDRNSVHSIDLSSVLVQ